MIAILIQIWITSLYVLCILTVTMSRSVLLQVTFITTVTIILSGMICAFFASPCPITLNPTDTVTSLR